MSTDADPAITYELGVVGGSRSATIALDCPDRANALSREVVSRLRIALDRVVDDECALLVLEGRGRTFCAGVDVDGAADDGQPEFLERFLELEALLACLARLPVVTIAIAQRWAIGAGADLLVACDYRIGVGDLRVRFPGWGFGIALGTRRLAARVGSGLALDALLSGAAIDRDRALATGLLTHATASREDAQTVVERVSEACARLQPAARRRLLRLTRPEWHDADAAELASSIIDDGAPEQFKRYAANARAVRGE
jgi:enoyl-CoA hydratase/carnithine racemase